MVSTHGEKARVTGSPFHPLVRSLFPRIAASVPKSVSPNLVTVLGLVAAVLAGGALLISRFIPAFCFVAAAFVFVNWFADTLDGELARLREQCSKLGDFLDHVFDAFTVVAITLGIAGTGAGHPTIIVLAGFILLLCFAVTYKGEQVTGIYVLLTFGPTEVRLVLMGLFIASYFMRAPVLSVWGFDLWLFDIAGLFGVVWASLYALILTLRYGRQIQDTEKT